LENDVFLSKGGRVILFKSTLANLPMYFMFLFLLLVSVAKRIEKLQRDFLWGGLGVEFKYHLVSWSKVCSPISEGGLGIKNLMEGWLWHYGLEREAWWRVAMDSKFGSLWDGWCSLEPAGVFGVGLWKNIRKVWENFSCHTKFEVGDRSQISFWHDKWCMDVALKATFPVLYGIARVKDASIADHLELFGGSNRWNVSFARAAQNWVVDIFASFFQVLHSTRVKIVSEDKLWWIPSKRGLFKV
jgi:hypothetical protein